MQSIKEEGQPRDVKSEAIDAKMAAQAQRTEMSSPQVATPTEESGGIDVESLKGRFAWATLGTTHIPYIFRGAAKFCAVRMVEVKLLNKYFQTLRADLISDCACAIRSYPATQTESTLLREINVQHCDSQFGTGAFYKTDFLVRLSDVAEFYEFLDTCHKRLSDGGDTARCGFIRIDGGDVMPYTVHEQRKYLPLFYFEGETEKFVFKAKKLEGWPLSYLKFCIKFQNLSRELYAPDSCLVIDFNDITRFFPPGTLLEDYWPWQTKRSPLLVNGFCPPQMVRWTEIVEPPSPILSENDEETVQETQEYFTPESNTYKPSQRHICLQTGEKQSLERSQMSGKSKSLLPATDNHSAITEEIITTNNSKDKLTTLSEVARTENYVSY